MKHQALFSSKDKSKKIKVSSAAILFGALRVKHSVWIKKHPHLTLLHSEQPKLNGVLAVLSAIGIIQWPLFKAINNWHAFDRYNGI